MKRHVFTIRRRIILFYGISVLLLLGLASAILLNLMLIEERLKGNAIFSSLLDATLEVRRFEKNFLLYHQQEDMDQALAYLDEADRLVSRYSGLMEDNPMMEWGQRWLHLFGAHSAPVNLLTPDWQNPKRLLARYRIRLIALRDSPTPVPMEMAQVIRALGRRLTLSAEGLEQSATEHIQSLFGASRRILSFLVVASLLLSAITARFMIRSTVHPLRDLEAHMKRIAGGRFDMLPAQEQYDEIRSMNQAFNRMLREILLHRQEILRSEKLASLGTMLAGIAHEVNNPLSNISTSAEILAEEMASGDPTVKEAMLHQIIAETDRARDLIRSVLEFTRKRPGNRTRFDLVPAIHAAIALVRGKLGRGVQVEVEVPEGSALVADKQEIQQMIINLVKNASDAMADHRGAQRVRITASCQDSGWLELVVADSGPGIAPEHLEQVFDPFYTSKDPGKGTGLGLYVVHQIVEGHRGTIQVENLPGGGAAFTIALPCGETSRGS